MTELRQLGTMVMGRLPIVVLGPIKDRAAKWHGKYHLNVSDNPWLARGPYESVADACAAIEASDMPYRRRTPEPSSGPHFDWMPDSQ